MPRQVPPREFQGARVHASGRGLSYHALALNKDPRSFYRMVRRVTGLTWGEVLRRGPEWVMARFLEVLDRGLGLECA